MHAAAWLICPVWVPYDPAGQSVHDVAPAATEKRPAGHVAHADPLRKDPGWHDAVPANVTPPDKRVHDDVAVVDDTAPSARQRTLFVAMLSNCVEFPGENVYEVFVAESAPAGATVAADHVGPAG